MYSKPEVCDSTVEIVVSLVLPVLHEGPHGVWQVGALSLTLGVLPRATQVYKIISKKNLYCFASSGSGD